MFHSEKIPVPSFWVGEEIMCDKPPDTPIMNFYCECGCFNCDAEYGRVLRCRNCGRTIPMPDTPTTHEDTPECEKPEEKA